MEFFVYINIIFWIVKISEFIKYFYAFNYINIENLEKNWF